MVNQNPGHPHQVRVDAAHSDHPLDLRNDDATAVVRRLRNGQQVLMKGLVFGAQIAMLVGGCRADERHINLERGVEKLFLPCNIDELNHVALAARRELAAAVARVNKSMQTNGSDHTHLATSNRAVKVRDHTLRQVVGFDGVVKDQPPQARRRHPVPPNDTFDQADMTKVVDPAAHAVTLARGIDQGQITGRRIAQEAVLKR